MSSKTSWSDDEVKVLMQVWSDNSSNRTDWVELYQECDRIFYERTGQHWYRNKIATRKKCYRINSAISHGRYTLNDILSEGFSENNNCNINTKISEDQARNAEVVLTPDNDSSSENKDRLCIAFDSDTDADSLEAIIAKDKRSQLQEQVPETIFVSASGDMSESDIDVGDTEFLYSDKQGGDDNEEPSTTASVTPEVSSHEIQGCEIDAISPTSTVETYVTPSFDSQYYDEHVFCQPPTYFTLAAAAIANESDDQSNSWYVDKDQQSFTINAGLIGSGARRIVFGEKSNIMMDHNIPMEADYSDDNDDMLHQSMGLHQVFDLQHHICQDNGSYCSRILTTENDSTILSSSNYMGSGCLWADLFPTILEENW